MFFIFMWSLICCAYEIESQLQTDPYRSLFAESGYPQAGDIPLLNRKIFRGTRVTIREHPYIVSVRRNYVHYVTASLLTKNIAVTVAHPLFRIPITEFSVIAGENYSDRGTIVLTVVLLLINKNFDPYTLKGDIALLRFYEDIVIRDKLLKHKAFTRWKAPLYRMLSRWVPPRRLFLPPRSIVSSTKTIGLVSPTAPLSGSRAVVTGWGRCDFTGKELCLPRSSVYTPDERSDPMLRTISFVITERNVYCDVYNQHSNPLEDGFFCAGVARESDVLTPCLAVPGAPLVVWGQLAGLLSWGLGCGYANDLPLIYTDIQYYASWLTRTVEILQNLTQPDFKDLFMATKSSKLSTWLLKTRLNRSLLQPISNQELLPIAIDEDLSMLEAKVYDIRDFLYDRKFHSKKKKIYKSLKAAYNSTRPSFKLMNRIHLPALKLEPFLSNKTLYFIQDNEDEVDDKSE